MSLLTGTVLAVLVCAACGKPATDDDAGSVEDGGPMPDATDMGHDGESADAASSDAGDLAVRCDPVLLTGDDEPFEKLSEYCLFGGNAPAHVPNDGVIPFEPIAVLYADESLKERFIAVPGGSTIAFDPRERWTFPEGTTLVKTFYFWNDATDESAGRRMLETRLLVLQNGVWESYVYIWNEEQTEANYIRIGDWIEVERIDESGATVSNQYRVPNQNQCASCHEQSDAVVPLGPRAFQLNLEYDYGGDVGVKNQLQHWGDLGLFDQDVDVSDLFTLTDYLDDAADLDARARSYLEVNCAHCHSSEGAADPSGLKLSVTVTEPSEYGVCRSPVAAGSGSGGLFYDIVPGIPEESIMVFRMSSTDPDIKMPELPTQTADDFGVQLISQWIEAMEPAGCPMP